jgi:hypothetical protein
MTTSSNGVGAFNATVRTGEPYEIVQPARERRALDLAEAAEQIEAKLAAHFDADLPDDLSDEQRRILQARKASLQAALKAARAEAEQAQAEVERARAEAREGN